MNRIKMDGQKADNGAGMYVLGGMMGTLGLILCVAMSLSKHQNMNDAAPWTLLGFGLAALILIGVGRALRNRVRHATLDLRRRCIRIPGQQALALSEVIGIGYTTREHSFTAGFPAPVTVTQTHCAITLMTGRLAGPLRRALESASRRWKSDGPRPLVFSRPDQLLRLAEALEVSPEGSLVRLTDGVSPEYARKVLEQLGRRLRVPVLELPHDGDCVLRPLAA